MPTAPPDRARVSRRRRRSLLISGLYLATVPGALLVLAPASMNLNDAYELWGLCAVLGAVLVVAGLTIRPDPDSRDRPFYAM